MTKKIVAVFIITLMFFSLCVENKENTVTTTTIIKDAEKCARFSCDGSVQVKAEGNELNIAYCDAVERSRIVCQTGDFNRHVTRSTAQVQDLSRAK